MTKQKDDLFSNPALKGKFEFNRSVARVFDDMLERSVPFYQECRHTVVELALEFHQKKTSIYDLGCSTGTLLRALADTLPARSGVRLVGIDASAPMLDQARNKLKGHTCELVQADLESDLDLSNASVVIMNYTLQFIRPRRRPALIRKIHKALNPGGCFVLIEKVEGESAHLNQVFVDQHHRFKRSQGYSKMEISKKRQALEEVLVPRRLSDNTALLKKAGFREIDVFFKWCNFAGLIAIK